MYYLKLNLIKWYKYKITWNCLRLFWFEPILLSRNLVETNNFFLSKTYSRSWLSICQYHASRLTGKKKWQLASWLAFSWAVFSYSLLRKWKSETMSKISAFSTFSILTYEFSSAFSMILDINKKPSHFPKGKS